MKDGSLNTNEEKTTGSEYYTEYNTWDQLSSVIESQFENNGNLILLDADGNADLVSLKEIVSEPTDMILMKLNREPFLSHILLKTGVDEGLPRVRLINDIAAAYIIRTLKEIIDKAGINIEDYIK